MLCRFFLADLDKTGCPFVALYMPQVRTLFSIPDSSSEIARMSELT